MPWVSSTTATCSPASDVRCSGRSIVSGRRGALGLPKKADLVKEVIGHRDGYGFASPVEEGDDFFLSSRQMFRVFDGDEVLARSQVLMIRVGLGTDC